MRGGLERYLINSWTFVLTLDHTVNTCLLLNYSEICISNNLCAALGNTCQKLLAISTIFSSIHYKSGWRRESLCHTKSTKIPPFAALQVRIKTSGRVPHSAEFLTFFLEALTSQQIICFVLSSAGTAPRRTMRSPQDTWIIVHPCYEYEKRLRLQVSALPLGRFLYQLNF